MKELAKYDVKSYQPQTKAYEKFVVHLPNGTNEIIPIATIRGKNRTPISTITAGQHGNEWNSIFAARELAIKIKSKELTGTLIIIPIANPAAFKARSRCSPIDGLDMNRLHPTNSNKKPTEIIAHQIFEKFVQQSNYVFDLHTGGFGRYMPHTVIDREEESLINLAKYINFSLIHFRGGRKGTLVTACTERKIPAVLLEFGVGNKIEPELVEQAVKGMRNALCLVNMIAEEPEIPIASEMFSEHIIVRSKYSGFIDIAVNLGEHVEKGEVIANVYSPYSPQKHAVKTPVDGKVIYVRVIPAVASGDSVIHIAR